MYVCCRVRTTPCSPEPHTQREPRDAHARSPPAPPSKTGNSQATPQPLTIIAATVYEEWHVVKRNRFGRRQERVLGVDATKIYNDKRDKGRRYQVRPFGPRRARRSGGGRARASALCVCVRALALRAPRPGRRV